MSLAQRLKAEGRAHGAAIARVQLIERLLEKPVTPEDVLASLSIEELERRFATLEAEYSARFKNG